jgi:DNA processing protein
VEEPLIERKGSASDRRPDSYVPPPDSIRATADLFDIVKDIRPVVDAQRGLFEPDHEHNRPGRTLYVAGNAQLLQRRCVAIVGTREVSNEGALRARRLARELAAAGVVVVSGLARGVDTEALNAALEVGGSVVAIIGTPLDKAYPAENKRLQERIYREHLLISPFKDGTVVHKHFFPQRNRVMAAVSAATVIIEASDTSGTLHQAVECTRLGRWLFIAKSVIEDPALTWPRKFTNYERTRTLSITADVLEVLGNRQ